jgi:hypothetical protein
MKNCPVFVEGGAVLGSMLLESLLLLGLKVLLMAGFLIKD